MPVTLKAEAGRGEKVHLLVNGEYVATTDVARWYSFGLPLKSEIDEEQLEELLQKVAYGRMYEKALDLLSQREYARKELVEKLVRKTIQEQRAAERRRKKEKSEQKREEEMFRTDFEERDFGVTEASFSTEELSSQKTDRDELRRQANEICDKLEEMGLLSDERYARAYAEELIRKKHLSASGLRTALLQKGISRETVSVILEELSPDPEEAIRTLLQTKFRSRDLTDEKERRRTVNALLRLGYTYGEVNQVIQTLDTDRE